MMDCSIELSGQKTHSSNFLNSMEKIIDPNNSVFNRFSAIASKVHLQFYTPVKKRYFHSIILDKYRPFAHSKFNPE